MTKSKRWPLRFERRARDYEHHGHGASIRHSLSESLGEPGPGVMAEARLAAGKHLQQMSHCARCRADACGLVGESAESLPDPKQFALLASKPTKTRPFVAVASREGMLVNQHVGEATCFYIFAESDLGCVPVEVREAPELAAASSVG